MTLNIPAIVLELGRSDVRYVLTGSVAAAAYGVPVEPRDLDISPDLEAGNLARLAEVLQRLQAKPVGDPDWPGSLTPEECDRWTPDPPTAEQLDHLFATPHGLFDVVPTRSLAYADLVRLALPMVFEGRTTLIAHPADLVATLRMHKSKHHARLPHLTAVMERLDRGEKITPRLPSR